MKYYFNFKFVTVFCIAVMILFLVLTIFIHFNFSHKILEEVASHHELAKVEYFNPIYISDAKALTIRANRNDAYKTNLTYTILKPMGNNFTVKFQHSMKNSPIDFEIKRKLCDTMKVKWMYEFIKSFTDVLPDGVSYQCPFPVRSYHYYNMEISPKTILLPMPKGVNIVAVVLELTTTGELIFKCSVLIHIN